jgi:hypothetical protein
VSRIQILTPDGGSGRRVGDGVDDAAGGLAARLADLAGRSIALHDNAKPGATGLLAPIGAALQQAGAQVRRWSKASAALPSPHIAEMSGEVEGAVFALGD